MRIPIALVAAAVTLAACGPRPQRTGSLEAPTASMVRLYGNVMPQCPFVELGTVSGRMADDIKRAAFSMHAHAVIMERVDENATRGGPLAGTAIQFTDPNCRG
ncbi:MAG TPA: hypothetical protein VFT45_23305 [Longimicrobium sp.]|nr:hypothetical protein [Longimicrobium sp.]